MSGGVVDGDGNAEEGHEWYRYGGMWKNKHEAVSAKMKKKKKPVPVAAPTTEQNIGQHEGQEVLEVDTGDETATTTTSESTPAINHSYSEWTGEEKKYTRNDRVVFQDHVWTCRKSHTSDEGRTPDKTFSLWKEL